MKRKYLDKLGVKKDRPDKWRGSLRLMTKWAKQRRTYGFDEREVWSMDYSFYCWLYEHLKMYLEKASSIIDLDNHTFYYNGKTYTQRQMIIMIMERLEYALTDNYIFLKDEEQKYIEEIGVLWGIVLPLMWY